MTPDLTKKERPGERIGGVLSNLVLNFSITMASQIRASTMGHRSPSQFIPEIMTSSEQGASIFASLKSEDGDTDDLQNDAEVHNITSYYSPINDRDQASESRILNVPTPISIHTPIPDQLPRQDFRGKFSLILYLVIFPF